MSSTLDEKEVKVLYVLEERGKSLQELLSLKLSLARCDGNWSLEAVALILVSQNSI